MLTSKRQSGDHVDMAKQAGTKSSPPSARITAEILRHFPGLTREDLGGYTFRQWPSDYREARTDYEVYDQNGRTAFVGREFGNAIAFWRPIDTLTTPQWASAAKAAAP